MRKTIVWAIALLLLTVQAWAQQDPKAKQVLDAMSAQYKKYNSFKIGLQQDAVSTTKGKLGTMDIALTVKGDKYMLQVDDQTIYNDGKTIWRYAKDINEVTIETPDPKSTSLFDAPSKIYTLYQKGFKYLHKGEQTIGGQPTTVIELSPTANSKHDFFKLVMYIDSKSKQLKRWEVYEKGNKNRYVFTVKSFNPNAPIKDADFVFNAAAHPGVEVVDLR